eukprot:scaffold12957_cov148-Skeletonema_marinoi.AAC.2
MIQKVPATIIQAQESSPKTVQYLAHRSAIIDDILHTNHTCCREQQSWKPPPNPSRLHLSAKALTARVE